MVGESELTRSHILQSTTPETVHHVLARGDTEVGEVDLRTVLAQQDVLRLEIAVGDPGLMARLHRVDERDERGAEEIVVVHVRLSLADLLVHVSPRVVVEDDAQVLVVLVHVAEAHDVRVVGDDGVQRDLAAEHRDLVGLPADLWDDFDGAGGVLGRAGAEVDSLVDDAEGAPSDEFAEVVAVINGTAVEVGDAEDGGRHDGDLIVRWADDVVCSPGTTKKYVHLERRRSMFTWNDDNDGGTWRAEGLFLYTHSASGRQAELELMRTDRLTATDTSY